jgi:hypothetical protein
MNFVKADHITSHITWHFSQAGTYVEMNIMNKLLCIYIPLAGTPALRQAKDADVIKWISLLTLEAGLN